MTHEEKLLFARQAWRFINGNANRSSDDREEGSRYDNEYDWLVSNPEYAVLGGILE